MLVGVRAAVGRVLGSAVIGAVLPACGPEVTTTPRAPEPATATTPPVSATPTTTPEPVASERPTALGASAPCTRSFAGLPKIDDATIQAASVFPLADVNATNVRPGQRIAIEGFPVQWRACRPCPPGAACKPCESFVVLADVANAGTDHRATPERDAWVVTHDPQAFAVGQRYRVVADVCDGRSAVGDDAHLEWRGMLAL
jgi:hypothetical protein